MELQPRSHRFRLVAACFCLAVYVQVLGLVPLLLALGATTEGSHAVSLSCSSERTSVVLHHATSLQAELQHKHGVASGLVCLLDNTGSAPQSDHVACFGTSGESEKAEMKEIAGGEFSGSTDHPVFISASAVKGSPLSEDLRSRFAPGLIVTGELRTIVLLI